MEQSALDTSALKFGNFMLDMWLKNEESFWRSLLKSLPKQICMISVYDTLVKSGELKYCKKDPSNQKVHDAKYEALKWSHDHEPNKINRLTKAVLALTTLAEMRLKVTQGV